MTNQISFWVPVRYESPSLGQTLSAWVDSYFYLGGTVAVVKPVAGENGCLGVRVQEETAVWWHTVLKVISYVGTFGLLPLVLLGVKAFVRSLDSFHVCERQLPSGALEIGKFVNGQLVEGMSMREGVRSFVRPKLLLQGSACDTLELNFAEVRMDGRKEVVPVQRLKDKFQDPYIQYAGSANEALLKIAQDTERRGAFYFDRPMGSPVKFILDHPQNHCVQKEEFLRFLVTPNAAGTLPLHTVNSDSLYIQYAGSANEALLKIAQDTERRGGFYLDRPMGSPVKFILGHPQNHCVQKEEFLRFLVTPNAAGTLPLHTVNSESLLEILDLLQQQGTTIDLKSKDPVTGETLFTKWAKEGNVKVIQALLQIDPTAIHQLAGQQPSCFSKAVLEKRSECAKVLQQAMQAQGIRPTLEEAWVDKAWKGSCEFHNRDFRALSEEMQDTLFQIANMYMHEKLLYRLYQFERFKDKAVPALPRPGCLLSDTMDARQVNAALVRFLQDLRSQDRLLTQAEFAARDASHYVHKESDAMGRILGRNYIASAAQELGLAFIKVPKKIAVIQSKEEALKVLVRTPRVLKSDDLEVYAEKITPSDRKATRQEMTGLLDLIERVGYSDCLADNIMMGKNQEGEEGLYFIGTEYESFSFWPDDNSMTNRSISNLARLMKKEDHAWFQGEVDRRTRTFYEQQERLNQEFTQACEESRPILKLHGFVGSREFAIPLHNVLEQTGGARAATA